MAPRHSDDHLCQSDDDLMAPRHYVNQNLTQSGFQLD